MVSSRQFFGAFLLQAFIACLCLPSVQSSALQAVNETNSPFPLEHRNLGHVEDERYENRFKLLDPIVQNVINVLTERVELARSDDVPSLAKTELFKENFHNQKQDSKISSTEIKVGILNNLIYQYGATRGMKFYSPTNGQAVVNFLQILIEYLRVPNTDLKPNHIKILAHDAFKNMRWTPSAQDNVELSIWEVRYSRLPTEHITAFNGFLQNLNVVRSSIYPLASQLSIFEKMETIWKVYNMFYLLSLHNNQAIDNYVGAVLNYCQYFITAVQRNIFDETTYDIGRAERFIGSTDVNLEALLGRN